MDLQKLFKTQDALDERIYNRFPDLRGKDNLDWKILGLQVELGECANEWRGFKKWSKDQEPRTEVSTGICVYCAGTGNAFYDDEESEWEDCSSCEDGEMVKNPLLEEYVDCLHFILSIGLELNMQHEEIAVNSGYTEQTTSRTFIDLFRAAAELEVSAALDSRNDVIESYEIVLHLLVGLGEKFFGFTPKQIEQAYYTKNKINLNRQDSGY